LDDVGLSGLSLSPDAVIASESFLGDPVDLEWHAGRIYILDAMERVIWSLDRDGDDRRMLEVDGTRPLDLFFGCEGTVHVTDPWDRVVRSLAPGGEWIAHNTGHRVFYGDGDPAGIVLNGARDGDRALAELVNCDRDTLRYGVAYRVAHRHDSVTANANYVQVALGDSLVVIGHRALGHLRVHRRDGHHLTDIQLREPDTGSVRSWYLSTEGEPLPEPGSTDRDTLLADLVRAAAPERFPIPVYVSDLVIRDGLIHVVINNALQVFDARGVLVARYVFTGEHGGQLVVVHQICFADDGSLLGLDTVHYHKIYDFGPLLVRVSAP
jgi:hypothetical protein